MNLVKQLRTWDEMPEYDSDSFHWLDLKTAEAADLIERQAAQIEIAKKGLRHYENRNPAHGTRNPAAIALDEIEAIVTHPDQALERFAAKVREQCEKACESEYVTEVDADDAVYNSAITYALRAIRAITEIPK